MENLKSAIFCVSPNCYMASIDLKDAYYFVCKNPIHRKYLRFKWKTQLNHSTCLPNGLSTVPRIFTKLLKPGFENVAYIDDTYLKENTFSDCEANISTTVRLFTN